MLIKMRHASKKPDIVRLAFFVIVLYFIVPGAVAEKTILKTENLIVEIQSDPFTLIFKDGKGGILTEGISPEESQVVIFGVKREGQWARVTRVTTISAQKEGGVLDGITETGESVGITIVGDSSMIHVDMRGPTDSEAIGYSLRAFPDEHFSGMGQRFTALNLRGQEIPTYDQDYTVPIPFFVSSRGYGIFVKTDGKFAFDMCSRDKAAYSFWVEQSTLNFYFIYGPTPKEILRRYTAMTGRMMRPPAWEFGVWKWRDWVFNEAEVYEDASMMKSLDIPASVILIDSPWSNEYIDYEFNPKQFPDPKRMINDLHRLDYRVLLWITPFINPAAKNYEEADEKGYFVKDSTGNSYQIDWWIPSGSKEMGLTTNGRGGMIDFTNSHAVKWWQSQVAKVVDLGVDGFKLDDAEGLPDDAYLFNGKRGYEVKNYPLLYCKAVYDLMQEKRRGDFVLIPRAGSPGSQKYVSAFWGADQSPDFDFRRGLPSVIRGGQSIGLVGFPFWGSDVGGYEGPPTKEVFIRWTQFGAFSPIMEVGGKSYHEPWMFDDETLRIFRRYAHLHTYLFPYISYYADAALSEGIPMMRPLFLEFPNDKQAFEEDLEYMFGSELLVAPIYQPGKSREVYLPKGQWMDFWSHKIIKGPKTVFSYHAPLDKIPLFVRVSRGAVSRLYVPLFYQQVKGFEERINYVLRGRKKILLIKPARQLRTQLRDFLRLVPAKSEKGEAKAFKDFQQAISVFKTFLVEEEENGSIPYQVSQTLIERLDALSLSAKGIVTLLL